MKPAILIFTKGFHGDSMGIPWGFHAARAPGTSWRATTAELRAFALDISCPWRWRKRFVRNLPRCSGLQRGQQNLFCGCAKNMPQDSEILLEIVWQSLQCLLASQDLNQWGGFQRDHKKIEGLVKIKPLGFAVLLSESMARNGFIMFHRSEYADSLPSGKLT